MAKISVVIPAYNYGRFLPCAIRSVQAQAHADLEIVIVDDCSTDDTEQRVMPFLVDPRLRYLRNTDNLGAVRNINKSVAAATGEFVLLLGADDFLLPGALRRLLLALENYPEAGLVYGNYVLADDQDRLLQTIRHPGHIPAVLPPWRDDFADLLRFDDYINLGATLFRRSVIVEHGFFDEQLSIDPTPGRFFRATDWDLCLRLSLSGIRSTFVPTTISAFRIHSTQASVGGEFDREGIALQEYAVLLERYLQPSNTPRLIGHEQGIFRLFQAKEGAFKQQADPSTIADPEAVERRLARAESFLRTLAAQPLDKPLEAPSVAVIMVVDDNPQDFLPTLQDLAKQTHIPQLLVINRGQMDFADLLHPWRSLSLPGATRAAARCYGVQLTDGDSLCFIEPGTRLAPEYLARVAQALGQSGSMIVEALSFASTEPEESPSESSWQATMAALLPEKHPWQSGVPALSNFIFRRTVYLRQGGFDKSLPVLEDLEFLLRVHRTCPIRSIVSDIVAPSMLTTTLRATATAAQPDAMVATFQKIAGRL